MGGRRGGGPLTIAASGPRVAARPTPALTSALEGSLSPVGLYLHVPFCVSLCPYCDFVVYTGNAARGPRSRVEAFVRAVQVELELHADELDARFGPPRANGALGTFGRSRLDSVYLGGGTPSLLPAADVAALLERIERRFGLASGAEVTIEANPGSNERGDLAGFRAAGVNRISFGAQSLDAGELRRLGRRHQASDVVEAVESARRAGIEHRSLDLLYDLPGQSMATWRATVEAALQAPIDHLSAYALTIDDPEAEGLTGPTGDHLPVRAGARRWRRTVAAEQDDDRAADAYLWFDDRVATAGFGWYEVSNWARPWAASRHNRAYWRRQPTLGVGPGAHSFDGARLRSWNAARIDGYLAALLPDDGTPPRLPPRAFDRLDGYAIRLETISLALRTSDGLAASALAPSVKAEVDAARAAGLLEPSDGARILLTPRGRLLAGELAGRFAG
ncbi:MAG: coproporphyrinogen-III oxidase family protein [Candidatus Limnocylindrales bacterium]